MKKYNIFLTTSLCSLMLISCNNGSGSSSTSTTAYTLPDGTTVLSNGAQISLTTPVLTLAPGKASSAVLKTEGGSSKLNLSLSTSVLNQQSLQAASNGLKVRFDKSNLTTGSGLDTSIIQIDANNALPGNYQININASNLNRAVNSNNFLLAAESSPQGTTIASMNINVTESAMIQATYLDFTDTSSLATIPANAYPASNIILFAFDNDITTSEINPTYANVMQNAITNNGIPNTRYFLSLGGATADNTIYNSNNVNMIVNNISQKIKNYNQQFIGGQITGVDLDLEQGIDESTISGLAQGFKAKGFLISIAPQVINLSANDVNPLTPTNLGLSSGGPNNQYGPAVANGYVNYIFAQTYNSGGWTVGGVSESQVSFFSVISQALNNTVKSDCSNSTSLCIREGTAITIGEVSNGGSGGNIYNIYASNGQITYNQSNILAQLKNQIAPVLSSYSNIVGLMQWSYNGDYNPLGWGDTFAISGAFTSTIFNAPPPPQTPPFVLQVTNTATSGGSYPYASATLLVNEQYMVYGNSNGYPLTPQYLSANNYQLWGTSTSAASSSGTITDSQNFDSLFANGESSFVASKIILNVYPNNTTSVNTPSAQYACLNPNGSVMSYTFQAGYKYNLQINPTYQSCAIGVIGSL